MEQDIPDYDMDSADEEWVCSQSRRLDLTPYKFEQMMDRLEKSSGQTVVTLNEAKALLKQDDEVSIAVYDYWLTKRLKTVGFIYLKFTFQILLKIIFIIFSNILLYYQLEPKIGLVQHKIIPILHLGDEQKKCKREKIVRMMKFRMKKCLN